MSNPVSRSVSSFSVLAILACCGLFFLLVYLVYWPHRTGPLDQVGSYTPQERAAKLAELRANETAQSSSYAWIDQSTGAVQLPIDRAMELTAQRYQRK